MNIKTAFGTEPTTQLRHPLRRRAAVLRERPAGPDRRDGAQPRAVPRRPRPARSVLALGRRRADRADHDRHGRPGRAEGAAHDQRRPATDADVRAVREPRLLLPDVEPVHEHRRVRHARGSPGTTATSSRRSATRGSGWSGPGSRTTAIDSHTWTDHTNLRPTILSLVGLKDNYTDDGHVLVQALDKQVGAGRARRLEDRRPRAGLRAAERTVRRLLGGDARVVDQGARAATTRATTTYTSIETSIQTLTTQPGHAARRRSGRPCSTPRSTAATITDAQASSWISAGERDHRPGPGTTALTAGSGRAASRRPPRRPRRCRIPRTGVPWPYDARGAARRVWLLTAVAVASRSGFAGHGELGLQAALGGPGSAARLRLVRRARRLREEPLRLDARAARAADGGNRDEHLRQRRGSPAPRRARPPRPRRRRPRTPAAARERRSRPPTTRRPGSTSPTSRRPTARRSSRSRRTSSRPSPSRARSPKLVGTLDLGTAGCECAAAALRQPRARRLDAFDRSTPGCRRSPHRSARRPTGPTARRP